MNPAWVDCCHHTRRLDRFLGTVDGRDGPIDVYVYQDNALVARVSDMHVCLRYGASAEEYISPGNVDAFLARTVETTDVEYLAARPLILTWCQTFEVPR